MLYVVYGNDHEKRQRRIRALLETLQKKRPDAALFSLDDETWTPERIDTLLDGQGLFDEKYIVTLFHVSRAEGGYDEVKRRAERLQESDHIFLLVEDSLTKPREAFLAKHAFKIEGFSTEQKRRAEFNIFEFTDAVGSKDKKRAWELYHRALLSGKEPEELVGILQWSVKSMKAAAVSPSPEEAGLKPFVFKKSRGFLGKHSEDNLELMSERLIEAVAVDRRGGEPLRRSLERFILDL